MNNEPKTPDWPSSVLVFHPPTNQIHPQSEVEAIKARIKETEDPLITYQLNGKDATTHISTNHFTDKRYALLFAPGVYPDCQFQVGYYVQMAGLGRKAKGNADEAVTFTGNESGPYIQALNQNKPMDIDQGGSIPYPGAGICLDSFWRGAENYSARSTQWAVSQAAALRRVSIKEELTCCDGGSYASGGFVANAEVGSVNFGGQQQCKNEQGSADGWYLVLLTSK